MKTAFDSRGRLIVVPARVFGPAGDIAIRIAVDTGASSTVLKESILALLGYKLDAATERSEVRTGSGTEFPARILVDRIESLGIAVTNLSILSMALPIPHIDGLLGLDYLRRRRWTLIFGKASYL